MPFPRPVIIFDPKCSLCLQVKRLIQTLDKTQTFYLLSLYDPELFQEFDNLSFEECYGKVHIVDEEDQVWVGADAVEYILKRLYPNPLVGKVTQLPPVRLGLGLAYDLLNAYRLKNAPPCEQCRP